jgi:hypothetical protein
MCFTVFHVPGPSKTSCFPVSGALWLQREVLSRVWGVLAFKIVVFSCLWGVMALRKEVVSRAWCPGSAKSCVKPCLGPLALQTYQYHVLSGRAPRATQKTTIWYACSCFWGAGHPKEGQSNLTLNLDQQPDNLKSTEKAKDLPPPLGHPPTAAVWAQHSRIY